MTDAEKITLLKNLLDNDPSDDELKALLTLTKGMILNRMYPFGYTDEEVPPRYETIQIQLVVNMYNKHGAEGESSHSENGISRVYQSDDVLLDKVMPCVSSVNESLTQK